jgi:hypothetical protein
MALQWRVTFGLLVFGVLGACTDRDVTHPTPAPSIPADERDASPPDRDAATAPATPDAAAHVPEAGPTCSARVSTRCPLLDCDGRASTLAAASSRCESPPFVRSVTQGSACGQSFVAYRYGASDTTIAFFDTATGELMGWWNESDTGEIECSGDVDLPCARATESTLPLVGGCLTDAGAVPAEDARAPDSGS